MAPTALKRHRLRVAWVLALALMLAVTAAFAHRALAATQIVYSSPGGSTTGSVTCYSTYMNCKIYPNSSIGTKGWAYRNWNDASWFFGGEGPWTHGGVAYLDTSGKVIASWTAESGAQEAAGTANMSKSAYAQAVCRNVGTATATNTFMCLTTTP